MRRVATLCVLLLLVLSAESIAQTTLVLNPVKDNSLYSNTVNPPSDLPRSNAVGTYLFAGRIERGSFLRRALVQFDVAGSVPAGANILSATLTLTVSKIPPTTPVPSYSFDILALNTAWGEGTSDANGPEGQGTEATAGDATWQSPFNDMNLWTSPGGDFAPTPSATAAVADLGDYVWGSTASMISDVQTWLDTPASNFGWIVRGDESVDLTARRFNSRENLDPATRPRLTITYNALPVELVDLQATASGDIIDLVWTTASEENNAGFEIEMSFLGSNESHEKVQGEWRKIGFVEGNGTSQVENDYQFSTGAREPGTYYFRLRQLDYDGAFQYSPVIEASVDLGDSHLLSNIYPNPFSGTANFKLSVGETQGVSISVYNALGRKVRTVFSGEMERGVRYNLQMTSEGLPNGLYFVRVEGEGFAESKELLLIK